MLFYDVCNTMYSYYNIYAELNSELQAIDVEITEADTEKKRVSQIPQTGDEFIR